MTGVMQSYKRVTAKAGLFVPIAPSNWMADEAMKSGIFTQRPRIIPYSVDTDLFRPYPKPVVRELLGLPEDSFIVLVSAMFLGDKRKGSKFASLALESCQRPISVVVVGHRNKMVMELFNDQKVQFTGYVREPRLLAQYYAAADVFLFPTLADNLPLSVLETMAAGTPTIGFRTGGVPDMLEHEVNAWLTEPKDVQGLVQGLQVSFDHSEVLRRWAEVGRKRAEKLFSRQAFIDSHLGLYREILEGRHPILSHLDVNDIAQ
jgi:glycosyltransferase involved in cell wall biosynthesis